MTGHAGHVMNLSNSIIGVGLLAMPFCFKQCGIALAIAMLILSSIVSRLACQFLIKSSALCRRRNFEFLAFYAFGPSGKLLVELGIIGFMMGTCVAFFVVMGDLGPAIISKILNIRNDNTLRTSVLSALGILVILPLGLLRNIESLVAISTVTIGFYFLFALKIFFESSQQLLMGDWWYHVTFWNPQGVLQCIPIFVMSLSCQMQLFEICESISTPTIEKITSIVQSALNICTVVYASVGLLGYIAYCKATFTGNILLSFTPSVSSEMFKFGFVMSIAVSFPLVIFPCRASLYSLLFKRMLIHHDLSQTSFRIPDARFKWITIGIVMVSLITGLLIPSIELVLGFVGSTIGIAICVIFPCLSYLHLNSKNAKDETVAKVTVVVGFLIMAMGTFGNLLAASENSAVYSEVALPKKINLNRLEESRIQTKLEGYVDTPRKNFKKVSRLDPLLTMKKEGVVNRDGDDEISRNKLYRENQRKEPPVPVAPVLKPEINDKSSILEGGRGAQNASKVEIKEIKPDKILKGKQRSENISREAIEKEEREIMEVENQKKSEDNEKQHELLKAIKEQKKLLQKHEKILMEMKNQEIKNQEKLDKILKEKSLAGQFLKQKNLDKLEAFDLAKNQSRGGKKLDVSKVAEGAREEKSFLENKSFVLSSTNFSSSDGAKTKTLPVPVVPVGNITFKGSDSRNIGKNSGKIDSAASEGEKLMEKISLRKKRDAGDDLFELRDSSTVLENGDCANTKKTQGESSP